MFKKNIFFIYYNILLIYIIPKNRCKPEIIDIDDGIELTYIPKRNLTREYIIEYLTHISPEFDRGNNDAISELLGISQLETYQLRKEGKLVSQLFIKHCEFHGNKLKKDVLVLYSIVTVKEFRKQGYARRLIKESIIHYVNNSNLKFLNGVNCYKSPSYYHEDSNPKKVNYLDTTDLLIGLHISPFDEQMPINYAFYVSLGFEKAAPSSSGPESLTFQLEKLNSMKDVRTTVKNIDSNKELGCFLSMFSRYEYFMTNNDNVLDEDIKDGIMLQKKLLKRCGQ